MNQGIVKSAGRAMQILEALDAARSDMRMSDIATALDIPLSSASVLVKSLTTMGFLDFDPDTRTYRPSIRVAMLGTWVLGGSASTADLLNLMRRVNQETGQTIVLVMQNGLRFQYINIVESNETLRFIVQPGVSRPIHMGASGIVLLSLKENEEISRILRHANVVNTEPHHQAVEADVMKMVRKARRDGYFLSDGHYTLNAGVLAVPLVLGNKRQPLAVGVGGMSSIFRGNVDSYLASLRGAIDDFLLEQQKTEDISDIASAPNVLVKTAKNGG